MALAVLVAPATTLLSTLERVRAELQITDSASDDVLLGILGRASDAITRECGRSAFGAAQYQETLAGTGSHLLGLRNVPILGVSQVLQDEEALDPADPTSGYAIEDREAGALYRAAGWGQTAALLLWGSDATSGRYILPGQSGPLRYSVTYTAGYALPGQQSSVLFDPIVGRESLYDPTTADAPPLPGAIEQACLLTVKAWWLSRARDLEVSQVHTADQSIRYDRGLAEQERALPTAALGLLRNYRRVA